MILVFWRIHCRSGSNRFIKAITAVAVIHGVAVVNATAECLMLRMYRVINNTAVRVVREVFGRIRSDTGR